MKVNVEGAEENSRFPKASKLAWGQFAQAIFDAQKLSTYYKIIQININVNLMS
jgi:hypothetical protein